MDNKYRINIYNEVNGVAAVSAVDGKLICEKIRAALNSDKCIILDFLNVEFVTSAFFNTAVGNLYSDFNDDVISNIELINITDSDRMLYTQVIERAKEYYCNPDYRENLLNALKEEIDNGNN